VIEAVHRIREGYEIARLTELLVVSTLGFLVNIVGLTAFGHAHHHHGHDHGHSHSHDHSHSNGHSHDKDHEENHSPTKTHVHGHDHTAPAAQHSHDHHNENMQGIFLHILADALGSVAVIISTLLIRWNGWNGWDPVASCIIAVLIFASAIPLVKSSGARLLLSLNDEAEYKCRNVLQGLTDLPEVVSYAGVRLWLKDQESVPEEHNHKHDDHRHNNNHDHDHHDDHQHGHDHSHENHPSHTHDHEEHDHAHSHDSCDSHIESKSKGSILGVIHIIAARNANTDRVRSRVEEYLAKNDMDVIVHVEQDGNNCWCGGASRISPR
jgi:zinc transporter 5/7